MKNTNQLDTITPAELLNQTALLDVETNGPIVALRSIGSKWQRALLLALSLGMLSCGVWAAEKDGTQGEVNVTLPPTPGVTTLKRETVENGRVTSVMTWTQTIPTPIPTATPKPAPPQTPEEMIRYDEWPLTFLNTGVNSTGVDTRFDVATMVSALNTMWGQTAEGSEADKPFIVQARNKLLLRGTSEQIYQAKQRLVGLEAPPPQVKLNLWAIQIAGKRGPDLTKRLQFVERNVNSMQSVLAYLPHLWAQAVRAHPPLNGTESTGAIGFNDAYDVKTLRGLQESGFDLDVKRRLNLTETIVLTGAAKKELREVIISELDAATQRYVLAHPVVHQQIKFQRLHEAFSGQDHLDQVEMQQFLEALKQFDLSAVDQKSLRTKKDKAALYKVSPERLSRTAAKADELLKVAVDNFATDVEEIFLQPLLTVLQDKSGQKKSKTNGVALVGQTRLVVSGGLESSLVGDLRGFADTTPPPVLTATALTNALAGKDAVTAALPGLSAEQARALALLAAQPQPVFTEINPGLAIHIRPAVMPDGGSARLQIDMKVGTETSTKAAEKDPLSWPAANAVKSQSVTSDAIISGFDLFNISSFAVTSSHPRPPGYVPVLGTLPLVGRMFQWQRSDTQIDHHAMVLVNAIILPRAMDIARYYGF